MVVSLQPYTPGFGDGESFDTTLLGSGFAVPAGLDAVLEYNGLYLNVRSVADRYRLNTIDGISDADIRDTRDVNSEDDGETPYNSFYGGRTIVIAGTIETHSVSKLRDMQQALRSAFADLTTEMPLHFRTGDFTKDHIINCKKISPISGIEQQTSFRATRDFQVTLRASNPRFLSFYQKFIDFQPTSPILVLTQFGVANNAGNYKAQPVFRIYGPSASTTIYNGATQESFTILNVPGGDYFDFDTGKRSLKSSYGTNEWNQLADDSDYVAFVGGDNPILFEGDSPRVQISWHDSWI